MGVRAIRRATRGSLVYGVLRSFGTKDAIESKGTCDWVFQRLNDMLNKDGLLNTAQKSCTSFTFFAHYATLQAIKTNALLSHVLSAVAPRSRRLKIYPAPTCTE